MRTPVPRHPGRTTVSPCTSPRSGKGRVPPRPRPFRGISASSASMPPRSWWSRPPRVGTWASAPPVSRLRRWRRSRCSRLRRDSRPSGIRSTTRTGWRPIGLPPGCPCQRGGIAASRPRPPMSARVGAIGYAGVRTRRRDPSLSGIRHEPAVRCGACWCASTVWQSRVRWRSTATNGMTSAWWGAGASPMVGLPVPVMISSRGESTPLPCTHSGGRLAILPGAGRGAGAPYATPFWAC